MVLGYIRNELKRFKVFVANRVQNIRNHSDVSQWKYVKTSKNPAGFASRGLEVSSYGKTKSYAQMQTLTWRQIEMIQNCFLTKHEVHTVCQLTEMTSDWCKMRRIMTLVILFIKKTQKRCHKKADINLCNLIDVKLIEEAQSYIIKMIQYQSFHSDIDALRSSAKDIRLEKSSSLY